MKAATESRARHLHFTEPVFRLFGVPEKRDQPSWAITEDFFTEKESNGEDDSSEVRTEEFNGTCPGDEEQVETFGRAQIRWKRRFQDHALDVSDANGCLHGRAASRPRTETRTVLVWKYSARSRGAEPHRAAEGQLRLVQDRGSGGSLFLDLADQGLHR